MAAGSSAGPATAGSGAEQPIVLVHGLARTTRSMALLARRLEADGFEVMSFGYASRSRSIEALAGDLSVAVEDCCAEHRDRVGFVTHSLGGILVRQYMLDRAADFLVVPHTHTFLMNSREVARQVTHFLRHGGFERDSAAR